MQTSLMHQAPEDFDSIRPYYDAEVREVVAGLGSNTEFIQAILRFKFPKLALSPVAPLMRWFIRRAVNKHLSSISSIKELQQQVADYMQHMLATTTKGLEVQGLADLDPSQSYLFISNHRDIAMDPALVNYALYLAGRDTVRIAIGDNLLQKNYVNDLMRLNKSFIVKRSAKGVREMLAAFNLLSRYIHHSLKQDQQSIWIAQKEGRAKDGLDKTDPAIIKMLCMAEKKSGLSLAQIVQQLKVVPVALSYEYDPLDVHKAQELVQLEEDGHYAKAEFEDIHSIAQGIAGFKGRVKVAFGQPLNGDYTMAEEIALAVDAQVRKLYKLFPSNYLALAELEPSLDLPELAKITAADKAFFAQRLAACPAKLRTQWLNMYANPVRNHLAT